MLSCGRRSAGARSSRMRPQASVPNRVGARLAVLVVCLVMVRIQPARSQDAQILFDPARLSVSESMGFLNATPPNATSANQGQVKHAYTAETMFAYTFT